MLLRWVICPERLAAVSLASRPNADSVVLVRWKLL